MNIPNNTYKSATSILGRLKELTGAKRDLQLAELLQIGPTTLSTWKKRNSVDYKLIIDFCQKKEFDLNFILLGNELKNSQIEYLTELIVDKVKGQFEKEFEKVKTYQVALGDTLDKFKALEEIEKSKKKVATVKRASRAI